MNAEDIITDKDLNDVWGYANFGPQYTKREIVNYTLLKCASGYHSGFTAKHICEELGLVNKSKWELTKKGKEYLYLAFYNGTNV